MKATASNEKSDSLTRITPVLTLKHPSYRGPVIQAAAALQNLSEQYSLKKARNRKTGRA